MYIIIKTPIVLRERAVYVSYGKLKNKRPSVKRYAGTEDSVFNRYMVLLV